MVDWFYLEKDLQTCSLPHETQIRICERLITLEKSDDEFSYYEANELIEKVKNNQLDKISYGFNYGMRDIIKHLKKLK